MKKNLNLPNLDVSNPYEGVPSPLIEIENILIKACNCMNEISAGMIYFGDMFSINKMVDPSTV